MYRFTTIKRLRNEGFEESVINDDRADDLIVEASHYLADALGQWFVPVRVKKQVNGGGASIIYLSNRIPFLEVISLRDTFTGPVVGGSVINRAEAIVQGDLDYAEDDYFIRGRQVQLKYGTFYDGRNNIIVDCYTGLLDNFVEEARQETIRKVAHSTAADLAYKGKSVELDSLTDLEEGDVAIFESNDTARDFLGMAIITALNRTDTKIKFDPIKTENAAQIPSGSNVIVFGKVPRLIERATVMIIKKLSLQIGSEDFDEAIRASKIKTERTDGYSYTLFGDREGGGIGLTGDPFIDSQLDKFSEPNHVDLV